MMCSTSAVAVCSWRASASSRLTRATSDSCTAANKLRGRAASVPLARFRAAGLRRRDLAEPALERRPMAFPEAQKAHRSGSNWQVGSGPGNVRYGSKADIGVRPRHVRFTPKSGHGSSSGNRTWRNAPHQNSPRQFGPSRMRKRRIDRRCALTASAAMTMRSNDGRGEDRYVAFLIRTKNKSC